MPATRIERTDMDGEVERGCDCDQCVIDRSADGSVVSWDVLMSGRIRCPECGAHIIAHFKAKHMLWHVHRMDITPGTYKAWRDDLGLV